MSKLKCGCPKNDRFSMCINQEHLSPTKSEECKVKGIAGFTKLKYDHPKKEKPKDLSKYSWCDEHDKNDLCYDLKQDQPAEWVVPESEIEMRNGKITHWVLLGDKKFIPEEKVKQLLSQQKQNLIREVEDRLDEAIYNNMEISEVRESVLDILKGESR